MGSVEMSELPEVVVAKGKHDAHICKHHRVCFSTHSSQNDRVGKKREKIRLETSFLILQTQLSKSIGAPAPEVVHSPLPIQRFPFFRRYMKPSSRRTQDTYKSPSFQRTIPKSGRAPMRLRWTR
mmetsp:Transcript_26363/g.62674  ORF Transcript_26363/g.62674 Transcript_26363/m.62674 type:complete len:124 (+) Transcript_26363:2313-2684(+)